MCMHLYRMCIILYVYVCYCMYVHAYVFACMYVHVIPVILVHIEPVGVVVHTYKCNTFSEHVKACTYICIHVWARGKGILRVDTTNF